jgi:hypothetical protein
MIVLLFVVVIGLVQKECMNIRAPKILELKDYSFSGSKARSCAIAIIGYRLETEVKDPKDVSLKYPGVLDQITELPDLPALRDHTLWRLATCDESDFNEIFWYKIQLLERKNYLSIIRQWDSDTAKFKNDGIKNAIDFIGRDTIEVMDKSNPISLADANDENMIEFLGWPRK